jgi:hypothetical protein
MRPPPEATTGLAGTADVAAWVALREALRPDTPVGHAMRRARRFARTEGVVAVPYDLPQ